MTSSEISSSSAEEKKQSPWPLIILAAVFIVPMVAAYFWIPSRFVNYGELVVPPRSILDVSLKKLSGESLNFSDLKSKLTLLILDTGSCTENCKKSLHAIYQIRLAQAKNSRRLQLVVVVEEKNSELKLFLAQFPELIGITGENGAIQSLVDQFSIDKSDHPLSKSGRIYVIDPVGNFMMYYPENADANLIWKDLRRLLKVSQVG